MPTTNNLTNMTAASLFRPVTPASNEFTHSTRRLRLALPAAAVLLTAMAPALHAEAGNPLNDRFSVAVGGFLLSTDTTIRVDGSVPGSGTEIDAGRDLGLQDADRFRLDAYWRMTPRQKLRLMWFNTNAEGTRVSNREIEFNGETFPVNI